MSSCDWWYSGAHAIKRFLCVVLLMAEQQYQQMANYMQEFEAYKDRIPEFIVKLYHILESKEYADFICWHGDGEVLIKSGKKLEEKVLPHYFRHKHLSSFIRQLNMYKFSKVNKLSKEKNHMYFRNEHFRRGHISQMTAITRNNKKNRQLEQQQPEEDQQQPQDHSDPNSEVSINHQLNQDQTNEAALQSYKQYVKTTVKEITESLKKVEAAFPESKQELGTALGLCNQLMEVQEQATNYTQLNFDDPLQNKNMLSTMRLLPRIESLIFPSQYSFCQFN